jgi:hypothetical protein
MNKTLSTTLTVIAIVALAAVIFFVGNMYARANAFGPSMTLAPGASAGVNGYGWNNDNTYGPSMMNGRGPGMMGGNGMGPKHDGRLWI